MTDIKALAAIAKIREKAREDEAAVMEQLSEDDAVRVAKFLEV
jgi:hypothetical protein